MNGWQRFGILFLCCFGVMVLFPRYDVAAWPFIGVLMLMWTGVIMVISLISNIFALERIEWLNRLLTLALFCGIMYTLLWYFPQKDKVSPVNKLKYGEYPTVADIKQGMKQLTFNFDFVRRNVGRDENFINQEKVDSAKKKVKKAAHAVKEAPKNLVEVVEDEEEEFEESL